MFDMSWGEVMLIGGVALVVIGPKDLPRALRTVGQVTGKLKRMAGEFQAQFNEAMREADLDEVKREVEGMNRSVSSFNPVQTIRNELKGAVDAAGPKPSSETLAAATAQLQEDAARSEAADAAADPAASSSVHPLIDPLADPAQPPLPGLEAAAEPPSAALPAPVAHSVEAPEVPAVPEPASGLEVTAPPKPAEAPPAAPEGKP